MCAYTCLKYFLTLEVKGHISVWPCNILYLLPVYKHQWITRGAFACEKNILFSHVKRSLLLWLNIYNKSLFFQPKKHLSEMVWDFIGVYYKSGGKYFMSEH